MPPMSSPSSQAVPGSRSPAPAPKPLLLCFSHLRWDFVWQRPQHLLSRAARSWTVIVFEEAVPDPAGPFLAVDERPGGILVAVPHLPPDLPERSAYAAQRDMVDDLVRKHGEPDVVWHYSPIAMAFAGHLSPRVRVYDCMDELAAFKNAPPVLPLMERRLFRAADLVFTGGMSLYEAKRRLHPHVHAFPSSIDVAHFAQGRSAGRTDPADQAAIPRPRLGFFGVVDERMDTGLVEDIARLRPEWQIVMIGPVVKIDPQSLPRLPNLHWLGGKPYAELPAYIGGWDVGIMPFALNESTRFISPTKTPEFLAAGVPVVSTAIADVVRPYGEKGLVAIAGTAADFVAAAERLMAGKDPDRQFAVDAHLARTSWDRTWASMARLMREAGATAGRAAGGQPPRIVAAEGAAHV